MRLEQQHTSQAQEFGSEFIITQWMNNGTKIHAFTLSLYEN
jgi:hypothetical protein